MIIDEHTTLDADAGKASAMALQFGPPRGMLHAMDYRDVAFASRPFSSWQRWLWRRTCAVAIEMDDVSLGGVPSHEQAIARIEQHLHGSHVVNAPIDPICQRSTEL